MSGEIQLSGLRCGVTGFSWVEARDAAKDPTLHRTAPHNKELSSRSVNTAEVQMARFN